MSNMRKFWLRHGWRIKLAFAALFGVLVLVGWAAITLRILMLLFGGLT